jgi:hypothetical protein
MPVDSASNDASPVLQRIAVVAVIVAAHVGLLFLGARAARQIREVRHVVYIPLPILPERQQEPPKPAASPTTSAEPAVRAPTEAPRPLSEEDEPAPAEPQAPIDWFAEAGKAAESFDQRQRTERERKSFSGPRQVMPGPRHVKPPCPFEQCEPGWGAPPSVFERSKRGRIEKTLDGEVIRWTSNHCYQILITPELLHRGMNKCVASLGKKQARGDLFDHMNDVPVPEERAVDVP